MHTYATALPDWPASVFATNPTQAQYAEVTAQWTACSTIARLAVTALACAYLTLSPTGARAQSACAAGAETLIVYHAGSLTAAFSAVEKVFTEETGVCVADIAGGSVDAARQVTTGAQPCDIFASADYVDIDVLLKPARHADYTIRFASGSMVLAYTSNSRNAGAIAASTAFNPPEQIPDVASDWYLQLIAPGVTLAGSHPFLDPSGYRSDMLFQLMQMRYGVSNLYNKLLTHYSINKPTDRLGATFDYQFTYEHSAYAAFRADATHTYRYARLPEEVSLGASGFDRAYAKSGTTIPGLQLSTVAPTVRIPATRVTWGLTVMKSAPNRDNAYRFLQLLFSKTGVSMQNATGPTAITPPTVTTDDYARLPAVLKPLVAQLPPGRR